MVVHGSHVQRPKIICLELLLYNREACKVKARTEKSEWISPLKCEPGRRGRQDIAMGILTVAKYGSKKTNLIDKVKLSSAQCTKYLEALKEAHCISVAGGVWTTTEKGLQVINACQICHSLMNMT
jgi:predicted transcriptional regulator